MSIPRNEYPRPQFVREDWLCLNGQWQFEIDNSMVGKERGFFNRQSLEGEITLPFCPESPLSGVGNKDFMNCVWYKRKITLPENWKGKNVILHIGAADYFSSVYVNGNLAGEHKGGYTSFSFNITKYLNGGENDITICCVDDIKSGNQPAGKQSKKLNSYGCLYTRTTGIWQTVWLEAVDELYIKTIKTTPDFANSSVSVILTLSQPIKGAKADMRVYFDGKPVGEASALSDGERITLSATLSETHPWDIGCGNLYDVEFTLTKAEITVDFVKSYFGLRSIALKNNALYLNERPVYMRLVLDQGFYPDGIYTAPSDDALKADILYGIEYGFNGARPHEKIFDPRYLYWADKLGYMVWGEHANWGLADSDPAQIYNFLPEWIEAVNRDYNHPSIIGWCPLNETGNACWVGEVPPPSRELTGLIYDVTKELDPTRPCIDTSGFFHVRTDIYDVHDYAQDIDSFSKIFSRLDEGIVQDFIYSACGTKAQGYNGEPLFMSEYGGITWIAGDHPENWGYGNAPKTEEEFKNRYKALTEFLLDHQDIMGFCYTQLYDVEQEQNGLMTYDRKHKFNPGFFYDINTKVAAIEAKLIDLKD